MSSTPPRGIIPNVIVAFAPDDGCAILEPSLPKQLQWVKQQGEELGERLNSAIAYAADFGFSPIVVLGADRSNASAFFYGNSM